MHLVESMLTRSPIATLPSTAGGDNVAQEPHCGVLEVVGGVQVGHELHDNLPVTVDVKLDQEPHGSLADAVGVEPHGDLPDEVYVAQVGQDHCGCLLNEDSSHVSHFFLHYFCLLYTSPSPRDS